MADLRIVARGQNLNRLAAGDHAFQTATVRDFEIFASEKPSIAQLRFLDPAGREVVRIDRLGTSVTSVEGPDLQDKADRYYFRHTAVLPENGLYVSKLDLNVERGVIEQPWKPMLRLAMPLFHDGSVAGVVVMNLGVDHLLSGFTAPRADEGDPIQLLNQDGYWLSGVGRHRLWGFMFDRETTMAATAEETWRRIASAGNGSLSDDGRRYVFRTLYPADLLASIAEVSGTYVEDASWTVLSTLPDISPLDPWRIDRLPLIGLGLIAIAAVCVGWSGAIVARRDAEGERRQTAAELVRLDRLASLGTMVAGVAHELNTPIGNAVTVASTLSQRVAALAPEFEAGRIRRTTLDGFLTDMREGTALLMRGLERAAELIRHFKQIAVDQTSAQRRAFTVADIVDDVASALGPHFKNGPLSLKTDLTSRRTLDGYPGPLEQVLTNLVNNALVHGFDDGRAGTVTIAARDLPNDLVELSVRDTGRGMPPDVVKRAFEPFFTTKLGSGGSGLGLSIVHNIVTTMLGGTIRIESGPSSGTTIYLQLPIYAPNASSNHSGQAYHVDRAATSL